MDVRGLGGGPVISAMLTLSCDKCLEWTGNDSHESARQLRRRAKAYGWTRRKLDGYLVDLCPGCKAKA